jgi:large subunit ribosomal protein L25
MGAFFPPHRQLFSLVFLLGRYFMGLSTILSAERREPGASNKARRLRRDGFLPAVFYGADGDNVLTMSITLDYTKVRNAFLNDKGNRSLFTLAVEGGDSWPVLVKDYQIDPVSRKMLHVDFLKIDLQKKVAVKVPLALKGKAAGVEKGGQLQQSEREITVSGLPEEIPSVIEADVSPLNLGQTMHLSQVALPENLTLVKTVDLPVALISIPKGLKAEDIQDDAGAAAPVAAVKTAKAAKAAPAKPQKKK